MKNAIPSKLYVLAGNGAVKLGRSIDPEGRAKALSAGANVVTLVHATELRDDASFVEAEAHRLLVHKRRHREWFDVTAEEATAAIESAIKVAEMRKAVRRCKCCDPEPVEWPKKRTNRPQCRGCNPEQVLWPKLAKPEPMVVVTDKHRGRRPSYEKAMLKPITIRLPHAMVERIEAIVAERRLEGVDKASVIRELLAESLRSRDDAKAA